MKIDTNSGKIFVVKFAYEYESDVPEATNCVVTDPQKTFEATGRAVCDSRDEFVKRIGRKIALKKAVATFPRETRKQIWDGYISQAHV